LKPQTNVQHFLVNDNQTIVRGYAVVFSGGKLSAAGDAPAAGTVAGVALEDIVTTTATATDIIAVDVNPASVYRMLYIGSATPAVGTAYDIGTNAGTVDADDSTGGIFTCMGDVDTTNKYADFLVKNRYNVAG